MTRPALAPRTRQVANNLTSLRLALQLLERRTELSTPQRRLVKTALQASDVLTTALLEEQGLVGASAPLAAPRAPRRESTRVRGRSPLGLLWRLAWPLGRRVVLGAAHQAFSPSLTGTRARGWGRILPFDPAEKRRDGAR